MRTLQQGNTGPEVGLLRRLLNRKAVPSPRLPEANVNGARYNGAMARIDFGPQTHNAVKAFQRARGLKEDGIVGPKTWKALGLTIDINCRVVPASQPTNNTCYAAAATMVLGPMGAMSFDPGPTPPGVAPDDHWARTFSRQFTWHIEYGMSPMPGALARFFSGGPFWFAGNLPFPTGPSYHAVVAGSMWGDDTAEGTMVLIHDPWPPNAGETYGIILGDYVSANPMAFRYILHR